MAPHESNTKSRLRSYFEKYAEKAVSVVDLRKHFNDVKEANLSYHLKTLVDDEFLIQPKRGLYQRNPKYLSPEQKRAAVDKHIQNGFSRVQQGEQWKPGSPPITTGENLNMVAFLGRTFGESILERMKSLGSFTKVEVDFVTRLLADRYPLTEQQRLVLERKN